jgi:type III secretion protein U
MSQSSGEKTEQPTDKKLRDARKRGQIAKSNDVTTTFVTVFVLAAVAYVFETVVRKFRELFAGGISVMNNEAASAFSTMTGDALQTLILVILPIAVACIVGTLAGSYFQFGFVFAPESMKPDLNKLNPIEGTKKIFALKNLMEFVKSLLKVSIFTILMYVIIKGSIDPLMQLPLTSIYAATDIFRKIFLWFLLPIMGVYIAIAAADYFLQRFLFMRDMKMTKDEVKREYKEQEGNPEIKGQRKSLHREMINEDTVGKTKSATVLVTNPTHFAVGLYYEAGKTKLPIVTVKGVDALAYRMIQVAEENEVPVVQNVRIAQHLYFNVKMNDFIPNEMLAPVAEILKWVQTLPKRR